MKYRITIETITIDPNYQDSYLGTRTDEIYQQTTGQEIDLRAIIDAFNKGKEE